MHCICQHLTLPAGPAYTKHVLICMVIVGSILNKDALPPPLFLSRYIIYQWRRYTTFRVCVCEGEGGGGGLLSNQLSGQKIGHKRPLGKDKISLYQERAKVREIKRNTTII